MAWNPLKPSATDPLSEFPSALSNNKIAVRDALEAHFFWRESSGNSAGIPRLSNGSFGPGSARAYFCLQSQVSSPAAPTRAQSGRLAVTSDTSRFFAIHSGGSSLLGGKNMVMSFGSSIGTIVNGTRWLVQSGSSAGLNGTGTNYIIAFPTAYAATAPFLQLVSAGSNVTDHYVPLLLASTSTNFTVATVGLGSLNSTTVYWRSEGTVAL